MVEYDEALKTAKEYEPTCNTCTEYSDGWFFCYDDGEFSVGGPGSGIVVIKADGKAVRPYEYFLGDTYEAKDLNKTIKIMDKEEKTISTDGDFFEHMFEAEKRIQKEVEEELEAERKAKEKQ